MKRTCSFSAILALLAAAAVSGEPDAPDRNAPPDTAQQRNLEQRLRDYQQRMREQLAGQRDVEARFKEALQRKISFEFVDTPLQEIVAFLNGLTKLNFVLDPRIPNKDAKISLKAADMAIEQVLSWVAKLADLEWQMRDQAIFIFDPKQERRREAEARQTGREGQVQNIPKLSVKLPDGTMIEADGPVLMRPLDGQQILDRAWDKAADGLLAYRLGRDIQQGPEGIEKIRALLAQTVPGAKLTLERDLEVVVVTAEKPEDLRRAAALMRAFGPEPQRQPFGQRDLDTLKAELDALRKQLQRQPFGPGDQGGPFGRRERPQQPEEQPARQRPMPDPGQF